MVLQLTGSEVSDCFEEGLVLRWVEHPAPGFEVASHGRVLTFEPARWQAAEARLQPGAGASYSELARSGEFGRWWPSACGDSQAGIRRFRLQLPPSVWERPWEGMVGALDWPRWDQVSLIRQTAADTAPVHPAKLEESLTVLCVQGAALAAGLDTLDLAAELNALQSAYAALDFAVRQAVAPPKAVKGRLTELEATLLENRPTVLWFSGHARAEPPGLLLDDRQWLTPDAMARILRDVKAKGGRTPLYTVLWACQTGSAPVFGEPTPAPAFVEALSDEGVAALLVSQARLSDEVARRVAGRIFTALASGQPLDHGVARARGELMRSADQDLGQSFDWMCPVVWSKGFPPPSLSWTDRREEGARRQGTARKLLPARLHHLFEQQLESMPWADVPRLWVKSATPGAEAPRLEWARRVVALQKKTATTVLWFDFFSAPRYPVAVGSLLREWAEQVRLTIEHDDDPSRALRTAAEEIKKDHAAGWRSLCSSDWFLLAIIEPPDHDEDWLWDGLRKGKAQAIVLADDYPEKRAQENWTVDALIEHSEPLQQSKTLAALAVLGCPAARRDIEDAAGHGMDEWIGRGIVVETSAGCVMPASVAEGVARNLSPEARAEGHRLAYDFLDGTIANRKLEEHVREEEILFARWRHALLAEWTEAMRADGTNLLRLYHRQNRAAALLSTLRPLVSEEWEPPDDVIIAIAWAFLVEGKTDAAISWLEIEPQDTADWLIARAEAEKSSGRPDSKVKARSYLEKALAKLEGVNDEAPARLRLRCRHDIARLTHFFDRKPKDAVELYESVERDWEALPYSDLDRAITIRNLAEALMDSGKYDAAEQRIVQARRLIPAWTQHVVVSELEYLCGRVGIRLELDEDEISTRFRDCRAKALATNHMMMAAIVEARIFRRRPNQRSAELFEDAGWAERATSLAVFERHAWAARVLISGRLRAAHRFGARGERTKARMELADARRLLDANPAFDDGSDRDRIALLYAGLSIYEPGPLNWWEELKKRYSWAREYSDDPRNVWELAG